MGLYILVLACRHGGETDFSFDRENNQSELLRLNGYYYLREGSGDKEVVSIFFLFQNGTILYLGSTLGSFGAVGSDEWRKLERKIQSKDFLEKAYSMRYAWGIYRISGSKIEIEQWHPTQGSEVIVRRNGVLISDTSFLVTQMVNMEVSRADTLNEFYQFQRFTPKPDSVSEFIILK